MSREKLILVENSALRTPGWLTDRKYKEVYSLVPRFCLDFLVTTENGFVLSKRNIEPFIGMWHLPGGGMRHGENFTQTAERILKKELNIIPELISIIGAMVDADEAPQWPVSMIMEVRIKEGILKGGEEGEIGIFTKIPENTINVHKEFLHRYLDDNS